MHASSIILVAAAAAAASAQHHGVKHLVERRDALQHKAHARQAEDDSSSDLDAAISEAAASASATGCLDLLLTAYETIPTPPPELVSYELDDSITDFCEFTYPDSLTAAFTSYESAVLSWYNTQSDAIASAQLECTEFTDIGTLSSCSTTVSATTTGTVASTSATGTRTGSTLSSSVANATSTGGSGTAGSTSSPISTDAGHRETGFLAGILAAAGVIGVVVML